MVSLPPIRSFFPEIQFRGTTDSSNVLSCRNVSRRQTITTDVGRTQRLHVQGSRLHSKSFSGESPHATAARHDSFFAEDRSTRTSSPYSSVYSQRPRRLPRLVEWDHAPVYLTPSPHSGHFSLDSSPSSGEVDIEDHPPHTPEMPSSPSSVASLVLDRDPTPWTAKRGRRHVCQQCQKAFGRPSSLKIHLNSHSGATPFKCPWPRCGRYFSVNSNMRRHLRNYHGQAEYRTDYGDVLENGTHLDCQSVYNRSRCEGLLLDGQPQAVLHTPIGRDRCASGAATAAKAAVCRAGIHSPGLRC